MRFCARTLSSLAIAACLLLGLLQVPAAAQYGGITGLFLLTSPDDPGRVDFQGLGCAPDEEVVLYLPGLTPAPSDPVAATTVPGRVLAVTTALGGSDPLESGTFVFEDVRLPTGLAAGVYEFHSRCGVLDVSLVAEIGSGGDLRIVSPDGYVDPIAAIPEAIPFTGRESSNLIAFAAALVAAGIAFLGVNRRSELAVTHR